MAISVDTFLGPLLPDGLRRCRDLLLYLIARTGAMAVVRFGPLLSRWSGAKQHIFGENGYRGQLGPFFSLLPPVRVDRAVLAVRPPTTPPRDQCSPRGIPLPSIRRRPSPSMPPSLDLSASTSNCTERAKARARRKPIPPTPKSHRRTLVPYLIM